MVQEKQEETQVIEETPAAEESLDTLKSQLASLNMELVQTKKGLSTAHQTINEKDKEIKRRANLETRIDGIQDTIEVLATAVAARGEVDDLDPAKRQDILADLKKRRDEQAAKAKQRELAETQQEYSQKADALYERAKIVFAEDDDSIERIEDLLTNGRFDRAEARVTKAEGSKVSKPKETNVETEEQRIDRLAEEKLRKTLEDRGLLENYSSTPSGSGSVTEARKLYADGQITSEEAKKRGVVF